MPQVRTRPLNADLGDAVLKGMLPRYERKVGDPLQTVTMGSAAVLNELSCAEHKPS